MATRIPETAQGMTPETVETLQDLGRALTDSIQYHKEAADSIEGAPAVANTFRQIASERQQICDNIGGWIALNDETPAKDETFSGKLRKVWTSFRAGLNSGDPKVVLIEAERAEDMIVHKFEESLPQVAGSPVNDQLNRYYQTVKQGHDRVLELRNHWQSDKQ